MRYGYISKARHVILLRWDHALESKIGIFDVLYVHWMDCHIDQVELLHLKNCVRLKNAVESNKGREQHGV